MSDNKKRTFQRKQKIKKKKIQIKSLWCILEMIEKDENLYEINLWYFYPYPISIEMIHAQLNAQMRC